MEKNAHKSTGARHGGGDYLTQGNLLRSFDNKTVRKFQLVYSCSLLINLQFKT